MAGWWNRSCTRATRSSRAACVLHHRRLGDPGGGVGLERLDDERKAEVAARLAASPPDARWRSPAPGCRARRAPSCSWPCCGRPGGPAAAIRYSGTLRPRARPGTRYSSPGLPWKASAALKTRSGRMWSRELDQVLQVVAHPDEEDLVPPLAQGIGDLVFHLGLVVMPGGHFLGHLAFVLGMVPAVVRGVEDDGDPHRGKLDGQGSCSGRKGAFASGAGGLEAAFSTLLYPPRNQWHPLASAPEVDGEHGPGSQAEARISPSATRSWRLVSGRRPPRSAPSCCSGRCSSRGRRRSPAGSWTGTTSSSGAAGTRGGETDLRTRASDPAFNGPV